MPYLAVEHSFSLTYITCIKFLKEGGDTAENLIPLCPNDHARYHRGDIPKDAIFAYKSILVAISRAFDLESMDRLLFLESLSKDFLRISGDGVLAFGRLIAAGLADVKLKANNNDLIVTYSVNISQKGRLLVNAWRSGDHAEITRAVSGPVPGLNSMGRVQ